MMGVNDDYRDWRSKGEIIYSDWTMSFFTDIKYSLYAIFECRWHILGLVSS